VSKVSPKWKACFSNTEMHLNMLSLSNLRVEHYEVIIIKTFFYECVWTTISTWCLTISQINRVFISNSVMASHIPSPHPRAPPALSRDLISPPLTVECRLLPLAHLPFTSLSSPVRVGTGELVEMSLSVVVLCLGDIYSCYLHYLVGGARIFRWQGGCGDNADGIWPASTSPCGIHTGRCDFWAAA
jgi:hypothetical protein